MTEKTGKGGGLLECECVCVCVSVERGKTVRKKEARSLEYCGAFLNSAE